MALSGVNSAVGSGAYSASVSDNSVLSASLSSPNGAGSYSVDVTSTGSQTNTISANGLTVVTDPSSGNIDSGSTYTLTVDGQSYQIPNSANTLNGLAQAINASGASVQATVVNVGSSASPDYRLSIQSNNFAPDTVQLTNSSNTSLLSTVSTGSYVTYQVDGQPSTPINSNSQTLTISPGVSVNVLATGSATVTVSQTASSLSSALNSFASAYNQVLSDLSTSRGQGGGALTGQPVISTISDTLNQIAGYQSGSGTVQALASLGLTFNQSGDLQFDSSVLSSASSSTVSNALTFLGSEASGGFLQFAGNALTSLTDPTSGVLTEENNSITSQLSDLGTKISADQDQVNQLQSNLTNQMAQADATISELEQQVSEITNLFTAMQDSEKSSG